MVILGVVSILIVGVVGSAMISMEMRVVSDTLIVGVVMGVTVGSIGGIEPPVWVVCIVMPFPTSTSGSI